jgi:UDP-N-acetylmuramyl tripeptide synthase
VLADSSAEVYLNADDPLVASLAKSVKDQGKVHFFGVEQADNKKLAHDMASDSHHCPFDGSELAYTQNYFGHIGHYRCPKGDFARPKPAVAIKDYREGQGFEIEGTSIMLPLPGLYNAYNALAAYAVAAGLGIDAAVITKSLEQTEAAFGRVERLEINGRTVYLLLIKNPTGFNQIIQTFLLKGQAGAVVMAINDNFADGRDVSWLWDVAIEELAERSSHIITSGIRGSDMALRLKYAGLEAETETTLKASLARAIRETKTGETVYVLPTYTAMLEIREILASQTEMKEFWA